MSHFTVMVFGKNVEEQLAPYNEQTEDKQFLSFKDEEDEYRQKYENEGTTRVVMPDGRLLLPWDETFRKPGEIGHGSNTHEVPPELEKREIPFKETYATFDDFMKDWCGHESGRDPEKGRYGYWHNENAKWDWYQMGGRWAGYFRLKEKFYLPPQAGNIIGETGLTIGEISTLTMLKKNSPLKYAAVLRKYKGKTEEIDKVVDQFSNPTPEFQPGVRGNSGLMGSARHQETEGFADQARKGDIDVEYMRMEAEATARQQYQRIAAIFAEGSIPKIKTWPEFLAEVKAQTITIDDARKAYHDQPAVQMYDEAAKKDHENFGFFESLDNYQLSEEEYVRVARDAAIVPFALVKDGKWFEKGEMGWWGCVGNEKEQDHWNEEFAKLFDTISDDEIVTVVDCHI